MKRKDFYDLAAELEKECGDWESTEGLSERARMELLTKVAAMEREKSLKEQPAVKHFPIRKRYLLILAASLTMLMGLGVMGNRAWISHKEEMERASEITIKIDNEEKADILREEEKIYQEISEKLGIAQIKLSYYPESMVMDSYSIVEDTGWAYVNYIYEGNVVTIQVAKDHTEVSGNIQWDGQYEKLEEVPNKYGYQIDAYCIDEEHNNYAAEILYGNAYYNIFGCFFDKNEFFSILNGIFFKNV